MTDEFHVHELKLDKYTHPILLIIGDKLDTIHIALDILNYETTVCKVIIAPNKSNRTLYTEKNPDAIIYHEYNDKICRNIMSRQKLMRNNICNKKIYKNINPKS